MMSLLLFRQFNLTYFPSFVLNKLFNGCKQLTYNTFFVTDLQTLNRISNFYFDFIR